MFAWFCKDCEKPWDERNQPSFAFTASLTFLPSTVLPASPAMTAFMTLPMSFALRGAGFGNGGRDGRGNFIVRRRRRQVGVRIDDLRLLLVGQIGASAFGELVDRVAALLDEHRHHLQLLRAFERAALLDALVGERGLQHAQRRQAASASLAFIAVTMSALSDCSRDML